MMLPRMDSVKAAIFTRRHTFFNETFTNLDLATKTLLQFGMAQYEVAQIWTSVPHFILFYANRDFKKII